MPSPDRAYKDALKVLHSLEAAGYTARLAGGCVRDRLLGITPADYDLATDAAPGVVLQHFRTEGRTTVPTGIDHGTITIVMPSGPIEVTTLRKDVATDGRHAQVAFGSSFSEDAQRRDFTINAMFEDADGRIYDEVGGQADLKAGVLRFVGEASIRIREDYLRILRLFRFWARFGFTPAAGTIDAISAEKDGLRQVSQERITAELMQLLGGTNANDALRAMISTQVWAIVLPELNAQLPAPDQMQSWHDQLAAPQRTIAILGGLCLHSAQLSAADLLGLAVRLRLSHQHGRCLAFFAEGAELLLSMPFQQTADLLDFIDRCEHAGGAEAFLAIYAPIWHWHDRLKVTCSKLSQAEALHGHLRRAKLPLTGRDLSAILGLPPGPEIGRVLAELRRGFRNGDWHSKGEGITAALRITSAIAR